MKLCPTCQHCYSDADTFCVHENHATLEPSRSGTRLVAGKYLLDWRLADDGAKSVFAGTHVELDRSVAVRLISRAFLEDPDVRRRFWRDAQTAALLQHAHVAEMLDCGSLPSEDAYIITEWVNGQPLHDFIKAMRPLSFALAARIIAQLADGLDAAHQLGLLHGGLKPSSIILTGTDLDHPQAKILGFGLSLLKEPPLAGRGDRPASDASERRGWRRSPEQRAGEIPDERSDIYGLGVLLYEMLSGWLSHEGFMPLSLRVDSTHDERPSLKNFRPDLPESLGQLIREMLHNTPSARPQTAAEVARRLRYFEDFAPAPSPMDVPNVAFSGGHSPAEASPAPSDPLGDPAAALLSAEASPTDHWSDFDDAARDAAERRITVPMVARAIRRMPWPGRSRTTEEQTPASTWIPRPSSLRAYMRRLASPLYARLALALVLILAASWLARSRESSHAPAPSTLSNRLTSMISLRGGRRPSPALPDSSWTGLTSGKEDATRPTSPSPLTASAPDTSTRVTESSVRDAAPGSPLPDPNTPAAVPQPPRAAPRLRGASGYNTHAVLQAALADWVTATNARDMAKQKDLYMPTVSVFYRAQNIPRATVLAEKARLFRSEPDSGLHASDPHITVSRDGRRAAMRFRKRFFVDERQRRSGEVMQELGWLKTNDGWKIISEREVP